MTSRATLVRSPAQVRNDDRKPCTWQTAPVAASVSRNEVCAIGRPERTSLPKTSCPLTPRGNAASRSITGWASRTSCATPAFIREAGTVQSAFFKSDSIPCGADHCASPRGGEDRKFEGAHRNALARRELAHEAGDFGEIHCAEVLGSRDLPGLSEDGIWRWRR
jgi:hypothetical protein